MKIIIELDGEQFDVTNRLQLNQPDPDVLVTWLITNVNCGKGEHRRLYQFPCGIKKDA